MDKRQKVSVPPDNYGRVYIGMLESGLSCHAKLCYGVMWSFGQESWASVASIGRRMSASDNTVRKAQTELASAGWIMEMDKAGPGKARHWQMITPAQNEPLQGVKSTPSGGEVLSLQGVNPNQEGKQEENQEAAKAEKAAKGLAIGALLNTFKNIWTSQFKEPYKVNGQDAKAAARLVAESVTPEILEAKALQFVKSSDLWIRQRGHAFWVLEYKWVEFRAAKPTDGKPEFEG